MLGERIKERRIAKGLTRKALGEMLGISGNSIYRWETGMYSPRDNDKRRLAEILDCSVAYLMGETNISTKENVIDRLLLAGLLGLSEEEFINKYDGKTRKEILQKTKKILEFLRSIKDTEEYKNLFDSFIKKCSPDTSEEDFQKIVSQAIALEELGFSLKKTPYPPGAQFFDKWIQVPILDPSAIACAGNGNGGMSAIYAEAEAIIALPIDLLETVSIDDDKKPFIIRVEGDSMEEAGIADGSQAVINPAAEVFDGDPALVCFGRNGDWAVKWVYWLRDGGVEIRSASLKYPPRTFTKEDINFGLFCIIGKVVMTRGVPRRGA